MTQRRRMTDIEGGAIRKSRRGGAREISKVKKWLEKK